ncbi:MAG: AI-2E family transporter [Clostridia bacterium]|nr:AI-2E family transporter [Clostridia bacterium]
MKFFKNADKRIVASGLAIALGAVIMYCVFSNISDVLRAIGHLLGFFAQVTWGLVLAYVMRPFARFIERILPKKIKKDKTRTRIGAMCSLIVLIVIIVIAMYTLLPRLITSATSLVNNFENYLESLKRTLREFASGITFVEIDVDKMIGSSEELLRLAGNWVSDNLTNLMNWVLQLSSRLISFVIVITMAVYALMDRHNLKRALQRLEIMLIGQEKAARVNSVLARGDYLMMNFLGSNLLDAVIIGVINFVFLGIVKAPYQLIMAIMLGVLNFIPTFGPIIGGVIGGLIVLLTKPSLLLGFLIFTLVLQQIDGNVIKPLLFGDSTGLSPFWVLVAIVVGGEIFGLPGMILGVPIVALGASVADEVIARYNGEESPKPIERTARKFTFWRRKPK